MSPFVDLTSTVHAPRSDYVQGRAETILTLKNRESIHAF